MLELCSARNDRAIIHASQVFMQRKDKKRGREEESKKWGREGGFVGERMGRKDTARKKGREGVR